MAILASSLSQNVFGDVVVSLALAHYCVGAWASRFHLKEALKSGRQSLYLFGALATWSVFALTRIPGAFASFHLHHVLGEAQPFRRESQLKENAILGKVRSSRFTFLFLAYLVAFRDGTPYVYLWKKISITPFVCLAVLTFGWVVYESVTKLESKERIELLLMDGLLLPLIGASFIWQIDLRWLVLYHISIWTFIPAISMSSKLARNQILFPMIAIGFLAWTFMPSSGMPHRISTTTSLWHFTYWGHLHHAVTYLLFFKSRFSTTGFATSEV